MLAGTSRRAVVRAALASVVGFAWSCSVLAPSDDALLGGLDCLPDEKACGEACVAADAPETGCNAVSCAPCALDHAQAGCGASGCVVAACEPDRGDCDRAAATGCEVDLLRDADHCGECDLGCATTERCEDARCVPACTTRRMATGADEARIALDEEPTLGGGDFTLEAWVRIDATEDGIRPVGSLLDTGSPDLAFAASLAVGELVSGELALGCGVRGANDAIEAGTGTIAAVAPLDAFVHVACVRRNGRLSIHLGGRRVRDARIDVLDVAAFADVRFDGGAHLGSDASARVAIGPIRLSRVARYEGTFAPATHWTPDDRVVFQLLTGAGATATRLEDASGKDHDAIVISGAFAEDPGQAALCGRGP
jgi:hypothetical protein